MTDLSRRVLDAITAKREAAAALAVKAKQDEEEFRAKFSDLLEAIEHLTEAGIANSSGKFAAEINRRKDDQGRVEKFYGFKCGFGQNRYIGLARYEGGGYVVTLPSSHAGLVYFYDRMTKLGRVDSYSGGLRNNGYTIGVADGKEAEITELLIDYIAALADR